MTSAGIYLIDELSTSAPRSSQILSLPLSANGTTSASTVTTETGVYLNTLKSDGAGHFYAIENDGNYADILEFGVSSAGTFTPLRRISNGSFPAPFNIETLAVDAGGDVAVASSTVIAIFGPTANGVATPVRTISGALTTLSATTSTVGLAFDASGNLYVVEPTSNATAANILVFSSTATGNVAPSRTIPLSFLPGGMALSPSGDVYVTQSMETSSSPITYQSSVIEFAGGLSGSTSPIATLTPPSFNYSISNLAFDSTGALYILAVDTQSNGDIVKFSAGATGAASPSAVIVTGPAPGSLDYSLVVVGP